MYQNSGLQIRTILSSFITLVYKKVVWIEERFFSYFEKKLVLEELLQKEILEKLIHKIVLETPKEIDSIEGVTALLAWYSNPEAFKAKPATLQQYIITSLAEIESFWMQDNKPESKAKFESLLKKVFTPENISFNDVQFTTYELFQRPVQKQQISNKAVKRLNQKLLDVLIKDFRVKFPDFQLEEKQLKQIKSGQYIDILEELNKSETGKGLVSRLILAHEIIEKVNLAQIKKENITRAKIQEAIKDKQNISSIKVSQPSYHSRRCINTGFTRSQ